MVCCCFLKIDHNSSGFGQGNYYGTGKIYSPLGQTTTFTPRCNPILSYHLCWEMDCGVDCVGHGRPRLRCASYSVSPHPA